MRHFFPHRTSPQEGVGDEGEGDQGKTSQVAGVSS